jgi:hypothetical protein
MDANVPPNTMSAKGIGGSESMDVDDWPFVPLMDVGVSLADTGIKASLT